MRAAIGAAISVMVVSGCGGGALQPTGAGGTTGTGASSGPAGTSGAAGTSGTICDAPALVFQSADTLRGCGSDAGCHGATNHESGLDLVSPGVIARLLDKAPDPVTSVSCMGIKTPYLISNSNPAKGLLIDKLISTPSCGSPQPFPLGGLPADQMNCLMQWATAVTTGAITP
jgi:hypothetical protein